MIGINEASLSAFPSHPRPHSPSNVIFPESEIPAKPAPPTPIPRSLTSSPSFLHRLSHDNNEASLEEAADVFGIQNPVELPRMMREMGISPWAALLAVGGPFHDVTQQTEGGVSLEECRSPGMRRRRQMHSRHPLTEAVNAKDGEEERKTKRQFLLKLARNFHEYGAPSHRFEHHMEQVSASLHIRAEFNLLPSLILVSFLNDDGESDTQLIKAKSGINLSKLAQVNALCSTLSEGLIDVYDASDLLEAVREGRDHPEWLLMLMFPTCGFTVAIVLFQLTWIESAVAGMLGVCLAAVSFVSSRHPGFNYLFEFLGSLVATFASLGITIGIIELSTRNIVSGTVRLVGSLFNCMLYGFGMTFGAALVFWNDSKSTNEKQCPPTSPLNCFIFFIPLAMAINLVMQANRHQWTIMTFAFGVSYTVYMSLNLVPSFASQPTVVIAIGGLAVGLVANIYSRVTNDIAIAPIYCGIMLLVPGAFSVNSSLGVFVMDDHNSSGIDGAQFTLQMLSISMAIAMGLFVATLIVWPIRGPKTRYLAI
ncbi:hypothetical protein HDU98_004524 [Podochytrium sp. JEL0797]|nr:hypothetical protein HDU98_004524 [Podochytrium sp. JEL0797]